MSRSKILIVAFLVLSAVIQFLVHRTGGPSRTSSGPKAGAAAPALSLTDPSGRAVALSDFRGKFVILDFWATWCAPCMAEFGVLDPWWKKQRESGLANDVVLIAVNVRESREHVQDFLSRSPLPFSVLLDEDGAVAQEYGVEVLPTLVIIDRHGVVVDRNTGYDPSVGAKLTRQLQELMQEEQTP
ncbi:MAG: TlpA family protein disulfide reductase [Candidatus Krumholzibacteria bacterium]|nr:TlpA family protein disulfide reductase [Candidatus Krumholzibacteria bacterium]MDH4337777.1 TlpA family protein disulfide reductase [Candidatus Krumholzibacteria bacterium]MDH5270831.1 TlpA family protein disulfide reductase [Candidatus Krumholzibacteria bacterium]